MMARGMCALTGDKTAPEAWRRFFEPSDVVGIKVNCGGQPWVRLRVRDRGRGRPPAHGRWGSRRRQIYIYERFQNQMDDVNYAPHVPAGVQIVAAETANRRADNRGYDPATYVEADLFGEEDTRSEHDAARDPDA